MKRQTSAVTPQSRMTFVDDSLDCRQQGFPDAIVALMIGELRYQPTLNSITARIVETSVELWFENQSAILVCEAQPMTQYAAHLDVPKQHLMTAISAKRGHTTRQVAEWLRVTRPLNRCRKIWVVTHRLHAKRAERIFARCQLEATFIPVNAPFSSHDSDWKLRSPILFQIYDLGASIYCHFRGWI